ncbi:MAG: tetratricopeptide repeat protein [Alphaproteobacteria bacterium]|nr:tetratricopeptide repeat protein [Alphaproteobacteria bacterium]
MSLEEALILHRQGKLAEAETLYRRALARDPSRFEPHYFLGTLCMQQGRFAEAVSFLEAAIARRGNDVAALVNLGMAMRHLGRPGDALGPLEQAIALKPDLAEGHYQKAAALQEAGRGADAIGAVVQALALNPDHLQAAFLEALVLTDLGRGDEARAGYDRLLRRAPNHIDALNNRALLAWREHDVMGALTDLAHALAVQPGHIPSLTNRALVLGAVGRAAEALRDYDTLLALDAGNADIWNRRGAMLRRLGRNSQALESFDAALRLNPDFPIALANRGHLRWAVGGSYAQARADLARALELEPSQPWLEGDLAYLKMQAAEWDGFEAARHSLAAAIAAGREVIRPFAYQAISADPASLQQCARIFARAEAYATAPPAPAAPRSGGRIRIGYVSAEFREQATAYLMAGVYEAHDRGQFEVIAFDNDQSDGSPMRARLEKALDRLIPIADLSDAEAAAAVRDAGIDILVNLNGYFGKPRIGVFAARSAPVQVNYLGFPGTLGAEYMDYIIADRVVIPEGEQRFYDEAVVWLPDSYQANDNKRARPAPARRSDHGLPDEAFVFCNFNQSYKLAPEVFAVWMRLLRGCENSLLWLLHDKDEAVTNLRREAERQSVDPNRLIFAPMVDLGHHLSRLALADLFLDTLPYNAHTTASDALWAGVPLLTCRGSAFPGRVAASLLQAAGLPDLICETLSDYEDAALALVRDNDRLTKLRAKLARNRDTCALFDTARFTRNLEAAYRKMMERRHAGLTPEGFSVS